MGYVDKKRINEYLEEYWRGLKGTKQYPLEKEISIADLSPIWDSCFLVKLLDDPDKNGNDFSYLYLGKALIEAYGDASNEKEICEKLVFPSNMSLLHKFRDVVESGDKVLEESEFINNKNMLVKSRSIMVPLGFNSKDGVGFVLGGMKWRAY